MSIYVRRSRVFAAAGAALAVLGLLALAVALRGQQHAPRPPASAATQAVVTPEGGGSSGSRHESPSATAHHGPVLAASPPVRLDIPAIDVSSAIEPLELNADRTVQVPPLGRDSFAGWYKYSPAPGQLGPSVILGHIDSARYGPGVFFRLGALRQRDVVTISRADRTTAVFRVDRVVEYPKNRFPTPEVYGNTDHAALRLITCGGRFNLTTHSYEDNIVVYASLVSSHTA
ncbi:MAG: hypothetical protein QOE97_2888 [Pseudonocardiales bacterium]|jgi:sortase (surface protein transpeptidase)|nr:hypothetical protein [Pseudonocardiales bacterium]